MTQIMPSFMSVTSQIVSNFAQCSCPKTEFNFVNRAHWPPFADINKLSQCIEVITCNMHCPRGNEGMVWGGNNPVSFGNFIRAEGGSRQNTWEFWPSKIRFWSRLVCLTVSRSQWQADRPRGSQREREKEMKRGRLATPTDCIQLAATVPHSLSHPQSYLVSRIS